MTAVRAARAVGPLGRRSTLSDGAASLVPPPAAGSGGGDVVLGRRVRGEQVLPSSGAWLLLPEDRLVRHVLVLGATGSGKTETALRLAWSVAAASDAQVFYLDGKGDRETAGRFVGLMAEAGRRARVFPDEPLDGWRGESEEVLSRLLEVVDYADDGPAAWYRDVASATLGLVCGHPDGPPRSSADALSRMSLGSLAAGGRSVAGLTEDLVRQVRLRYQAFFAQTRGALDGGWGWDEIDSGYLLLDSLALKREAAGLARFVLEDFAQYFTKRKPRGRLCVLVVDEFSAIAEAVGMAQRIEQARGFRTALILAPQSVAGLGEPAQAARILASVETVICHRVNTPEEICALAGTRRSLERSIHLEDGRPSGQGSARLQHQFKVDPNDVRALVPGEAFVISRGRAARARIAQAPPCPTCGVVPVGRGSSESVAVVPARRVEREVPY